MISTKILKGLAALSIFATAGAFAAPITDIQDFSTNTATEYFVENDANKTDAPYYRGLNQDWDWAHGAIAGNFTTIELQISAYDVDSDSANAPEVDMISIFDGSDWLEIGALEGSDNSWAFTTFDLSGFAWAAAQVNAGLQVMMNIDSTETGNWLVTLGKSTLNVDGGNQACVPTPGIPCTTTTSVPEPSILFLFAIGLIGFGLPKGIKRKLARA